MKRLIPLLTILLLFGFTVSAQEGNAPEMTFEFETYDFGELQEGDPAEIDFNFTNTGMEKLIITNVKASCGCTTPYWSKEPVLPGEDGKITAKYNTVNRIGSFNKAITITSNAMESPKRIFIKGKVVEAPENDGVPEKKPSIVNDLGSQ